MLSLLESPITTREGKNMVKATLTVNGQPVTFEGESDEVAQTVAKLMGAPEGNGAVQGGVWTPQTAGQLVQAIQDDALRMLAKIARDAPNASIDGIREEMKLKTPSEASGRLSSIGFARRAFNLPKPYRPRARTYEMQPPVAEIFREATTRELKRRGIS
jgi:hypothetical protein